MSGSYGKACQIASLALLSFTLAGCGGGGGGGGNNTPAPVTDTPPPVPPPVSPPVTITPPPPVTPDPNATFSDGLNASGQASGTIQIGSTHSPGPSTMIDGGAIGVGSSFVIVHPSVAAGPNGKILAVWRERTGFANTAYFNTGTIAGQWGEARQLTQVGQFDPVASDLLGANALNTGFALRMNAKGDAAISWTEPLQGKIATWFNHKSRMLRYAHDTGWSPNATDMLSPVTNFSGEASTNDLQMLDDGSVVFSDYIPSIPTVKLYRQIGDAAPTTVATLANSSQASQQAFSTDPAGNAVAVYVDGNLNGFDLNIPTAVSGISNIIQINVPRLSCGPAPWRSPNVAVANPRYSIIAYTLDDSSRCSLRLATRDATTGQISFTPDMTPGTFIEQPPLLAMDQNGNGVVVWEERSGDVASPTSRPVFADAKAGSALSPPRLLGSNYADIGKKVASIPLRFAMNRAGKGVAAMVIQNNGFLYLATSLYSVSGGFAAWKLAATADNISVPNVAISDTGDALVTWGAAANCKRVAPATSISCSQTQQGIYMLKL